ncbi:ABC transporter permease [Thermogemmatispora sp.]|uniref:ABC transporter permease n=1 Tax=Thermogemmatispora sp. TaxID=1968838 RepID=UPI001D4AB1B3|nr:ABC transporter permease subunit [Thermogemmatispora sp.]MBX5450480.1 ABC transporter permease subunit [Thermogemmatispora sp.]
MATQALSDQQERLTMRATAAAGGQSGNRHHSGRLASLLTWVTLLPFLLFCLLFEILPVLITIEGSFTNGGSSGLSLASYQRLLAQASNLRAFQNSIALSLVTALIGGLVGAIAAYGLANVRLSWLRKLLISFCSIAANFAGVPLAFAFVATLGVTGFVTVALRTWLHLDLYSLGFSIYQFWGLVLVYIYFQLPLMILVTLPALAGLRPEWREAAINLGASPAQYWQRVALPILWPSLVAGTMLLFANAFGAFATAYALAQGNINLVPILIDFLINGNVTVDFGLGDALAVGMIVVLLVAVAIYTAMLRRASRWQGH